MLAKIGRRADRRLLVILVNSHVHPRIDSRMRADCTLKTLSGDDSRGACTALRCHQGPGAIMQGVGADLAPADKWVALSFQNAH